MKWLVLCDGGPNDRIVGQEVDSLPKACELLKSMMRNFVASVGMIEKLDPKHRKLDQIPVRSESEAGVVISRYGRSLHE